MPDLRGIDGWNRHELETLPDRRQNLGWSLREVERRSGGRVHNAYLSQIETGRTKEPSVELLATLAQLYGADLWQLMHRAGWVPAHYRNDSPAPQPTGWDLPPRPVRRPRPPARAGKGPG